MRCFRKKAHLSDALCRPRRPVLSSVGLRQTRALFSGLGCWDDMCKTPAARLAREGDLTLGQCKQGVVFAHTDILAGVELGATLTNDDIAG